ncbi:MAG: autotransporter outer membrane beta-barrel domain-containing protein [Verrucomicrobiales bacterium]|nr:autotransporter outer membrane beta-barrel domain-containing protein [Verrucomicrobiales bacterium]
MKTQKLTLIVTLCALSASALNIFAAPKLVDSGTVIESDANYSATSGIYALTVTGSGVFYSGTDIQLSSLQTNPNSGGAVVRNQGTLSLHGGSVSTIGMANHGVAITGTSLGRLEGVTIATVGVNNNAVYASGSSAIIIIGGSLTTDGTFSYGIATDGLGVTAEAREVSISTSGYGGQAVYAMNNSFITVADSTVVTTGSASQGIYANNRTLVNVENTTVRVTGNNSCGIYVYHSSTVVFTGGDIVVSGTRGHGAATAGSENQGLLILNETSISVTGPEANGLNLETSFGDHGVMEVVVNGGVIDSAQGSGITVDRQLPNADGTWPAVTDLAGTNETYNLTVTNGAQISGTSALEVGSIYTGTDSHGKEVPIDKHTVVNMRVADGSMLAGDVNVKDTATVIVDLNNSELTGNTAAKDKATLIISGSNGAAITGDVTGSGTAAIDVTLSGSNSILLGDIAQNDEAVVTITISDDATGSGGFSGGDLIVSDSGVWDFDKDSHVTNGDNSGTLNIGDHAVTFDNLDHTGTINLSVNSDTGDGGSITVETATGDGTMHVDTTGNGQLNPNDVLPGLVSGDGTEHWQWDPINWGIDEIIKDGDHFVKNGTSPAGAVLNSSVAIQQAMWFAQQNSLLKRMGELRYGARASRPPADKEVRVPYNSLIDNIWIRSYGQQLNVGSQVAGKAYEQLIYGVDLGTDHKFTISADRDLYLGVYAGYGRSDIDYRTPGADGELNSYYGGLYATWLHASGFYIDATFKAASVDNDLKAPYGTTQLTASYSDVNLGGSLEIGNKFTFTDDWFIEPQFQVNYLHILAEDYTAGPMSLKAQDLDALQLRLGSLFGRTINLTNGGALQPYVKISGVETISTGVAIRNGYQSTRANTDGARAELGGGLIWQLDTNNQLHLDYEASFGDKYDKPWGLTAGYRHQF